MTKVLYALIAAVVACVLSGEAAAKSCEGSWQGPERISFDLSEPTSGEALTLDTAALQDRFTELTNKAGAEAGTLALIAPDGGVETAAVGVEPSDAFWWASATKLVTAALIHQLTEEGVLSLDDTLARWGIDVPGASDITVDQLLRHTSGLFSFNADKKVREKPRYRSPDQLLEIASKHGPDFCPGTNFAYSNTGYLVLGLIAEQATGLRFADLVRLRISEPHGLASLAVVTRKDAPAYVQSPVAGFMTPEALSSIGGAGAMVATASDMALFLRKLLGGEIVSQPTLSNLLQDASPMAGTPMFFGAGMMAITVDDPERPSVWIGHSGGAPRGKGLVVLDTRSGAIIAMAFDRQAPAEAAANTLLKGFGL
ncbi:MAG: serine hydrolase domain-containing protein [Parvularcula sp.]|jgi:D-alanyl-D-alanine carboxypeptidase|nr:serine hydrolase domain-containing protein [Parvularcula sp.]